MNRQSHGHQRQFQPQKSTSKERTSSLKRQDPFGGTGQHGSPMHGGIDLGNQAMSGMDMDQQYYDDQIFSDLGGSMKQQEVMMKQTVPVKTQQKK